MRRPLFWGLCSGPGTSGAVTPASACRVYTSHPQSGCDRRLSGHTSEVTWCAGAEQGLGPRSGPSTQPCGFLPSTGGPGRKRCQLLLTSASVNPDGAGRTQHIPPTPTASAPLGQKQAPDPRAASGPISGPGSSVPSAHPRTSRSSARRLPEHVGGAPEVPPPRLAWLSASCVLSTADEAHRGEPERGMQGRREGDGALRAGRPLPGSCLSSTPTPAA